MSDFSNNLVSLYYVKFNEESVNFFYKKEKCKKIHSRTLNTLLYIVKIQHYLN
jgi:hypothetical protein